jgi:hypothetical protein
VTLSHRIEPPTTQFEVSFKFAYFAAFRQSPDCSETPDSRKSVFAANELWQIEKTVTDGSAQLTNARTTYWFVST